MTQYIGANTGYIISNVDIGANLITKDYLIDVYPNIVDQLRTSGLWVWGRNTYGQLGNNETAHRSSPIQISGNNWRKVDSGFNHSIGIKTDGTLWGWGSSGLGQIGDNTITTRSSPVQVFGGGTNWTDICASIQATFAIKSDSTLWSWGSNDSGQLGTTDRIHRSSPVQTISGGTNWKQVSSFSATVAAVKTDGTLWTWGSNQYGALGGDIALAGLNSRSSPAQVVGNATNWKQVTVANLNVLALKTDGTLWGWGRNFGGALGINSTAPAGIRSSPVQVFGGGTNWKELAPCKANAIGAVKTDGSLWVWGFNNYGALGTNDVANKSSPVQTASGGTNWLRAYFGVGGCAAIKTDGSLWVWGFNSYSDSVLGISAPGHRSSPVQTAAGGNNWRQASVYTHTVAIRDNSEDFI